MADKRVQIVVAAKGEGADEIKALARELDGIAQSGSDAAPEAAKLAAVLRTLGQQNAAVAQFAALKKQSVELKDSLEAARAATSAMGRELATAEAPTAKMRREFDQSRKALEQLEQRYQGNQRQLNTLRQSFGDAGISATKLASEQKRLSSELSAVSDQARKFPASLATEQNKAAEAARNMAEQERESARAAQAHAKAIEASLSEVVGMRRAFESARAETTRLGNEMAKGEKPSADLRREFEKSARTTMQLEGRLKSKQATLARLSVEVSGNAAAEKKLAAIQLEVVQSLNRSSVAAWNYEASLKKASAATRGQAAANVANSESMDMAAGAVRGGLAAVAGSLTAGAAFNAMLSMDGLRLSLETVTGSAESAAKELEYIKGVSERLGLETLSTANAWVKFSSATKGTAMEGDKARRIFEATASSLARMGKSSAEVEGALTALEQMISKGSVSSEELKGQLGERLPGAFKLAANAIGVTEAELTKLLDTGSITADQLLPKLADEMEKAFGDPQKSVVSLGASWQRLKNSLFGTAGEQGNGLLGGALVAAFDSATASIKQTGEQITAIREKWSGLQAAFSTDGIAAKFSSITAMAKESAAAMFNWSLTGKLVESWKANFGDAAKAAEDGAAKTTAAQKKVQESSDQTGQSMARLQIDFQNAKKAQDESSASAERSAKARLDEAKATLDVAKANGDEAAARQAALLVAQAEQALKQTQLASKQAELGMAERELVLMAQQNDAKTKLSQADRDKVIAQKEKVQAITDEVLALENATRAANANANAAKLAADSTLAAFKALGITSQAEAKKAADTAAAAFKQVEIAAQSGAATITDVQKAFLSYAAKVIATGDATAIAAAQSRAAVLGVGDEFDKLAVKAVQAGDAGAVGLQRVSDSARQTSADVSAATREIADNTARIADEVAGKQGQFVSTFRKNLQGLVAETSEATGAMADEIYRRMISSASSIRDWWNAIEASQVNARLEFERQNSALDYTISNLQSMGLSAQSAEVDINSLAGQFGLLDEASLGRLRSEVERINGEVRRLKDEARQATDQLNQMGRSAQDEIDRAAGNTAAIEQRRMQEELRRIEELAQKSGDRAAADAARAKVEEAARQRVAEAAQRDAEAKARAAEQSKGGGAGGNKVVNAKPDAPQSPIKTVRIDLAIPGGGRQVMDMADESSAEALIAALEGLKKRGSW